MSTTSKGSSTAAGRKKLAERTVAPPVSPPVDPPSSTAAGRKKLAERSSSTTTTSGTGMSVSLRKKLAKAQIGKTPMTDEETCRSLRELGQAFGIEM